MSCFKHRSFLQLLRCQYYFTVRPLCNPWNTQCKCCNVQGEADTNLDSYQSSISNQCRSASLCTFWANHGLLHILNWAWCYLCLDEGLLPKDKLNRSLWCLSMQALRVFWSHSFKIDILEIGYDDMVLWQALWNMSLLGDPLKIARHAADVIATLGIKGSWQNPNVANLKKRPGTHFCNSMFAFTGNKRLALCCIQFCFFGTGFEGTSASEIVSRKPAENSQKTPPPNPAVLICGSNPVRPWWTSNKNRVQISL